MQHLIQYTINVDDEVIKKRIEESAYDDILKTLTDEARDALPKKGYYNWKDDKKVIDWNEALDNSFKSFLDDNRDEIIEVAATKLYESIKRTKKFKERMDEVME